MGNMALLRYVHDSVEIGQCTGFGLFCVIEEGCIIGKNCYIGNSCVLRKRTIIGNDTVIGHLTVLEGDCTVGDRCLIHTQCHITKGVTIEDDVFIGSLTTTGNDRRMCHNRRDKMRFVPEPIVIKRAARIGQGTTILAGVTIGVNAVVGAHSLVAEDVPNATVVAGVPARRLRYVDAGELL